jgi:N-methylhydantoinase A
MLVGRGGLGARRLAGPALIEDPTSTLLIPSGWTARRDASHNTVLERTR